MAVLFLDTETYCETPIENGTHVYAQDAEILLWPYAIDDGEVQIWDKFSGELMPSALLDALEDEATTLVAHNSFFDRNIIRYAEGMEIPPTRWHDTMVRALAHSLPGGLGQLCEILGAPEDKSKVKRGRELVMLFCKPLPKNSKIRRATPETHPAEWEEFKHYAKQDVEAMRYIYKKLPTWNYKGDELAYWHLDQVINDRGFLCDTDLADAAIRAVDKARVDLDKRTVEITSDALRSTTQRDKLLAWVLQEHGIDLPDSQASTIERRVADESLPEGLRELLRIRLQATTTSTSKYKALVKSVSSDRRLRGALQFNGASRTGRYAGRIFQPQNLPRPNMKQRDIDLGIQALKLDCADLVYPDVMRLASNALRGTIVAPQGKKLVVADLSNIEGRVLAWLAGEHWKLQAFKAYDAGTGHDLYALAYAKSFGVSPEVVMDNKENGDGNMRQVGKVQELALGYQGGVGAFLTFANGYNIDLEGLAGSAYANLPAALVKESEGYLSWLYGDQFKKPKTEEQKQAIRYGLSTEAYIMCDVFKRGWREAHPNIATWWRELEESVRLAIENPGRAVPCRRVKAIRTSAWLRIVLPSGRSLCYPSPKLGGKCPTCEGTGKLLIEGIEHTCPDCDGERAARANQISYMGINNYTRKWQRISTYGGKLAENITQAVARDILVGAMPRIEAAGYQITLSVHDEFITEAPDTEEFTAENLAAIMSTNPTWASGLPLAAAGFESYRYKKE